MNSNNDQPKAFVNNIQLPKETFDFLQNEKSLFIGNLVHNLKNPVGSALSFSEMILDDADNYPPEKLKRHLNIIKSSCEAAILQLEMLLIVSKIEANSLDIYVQETLFSDLIKTCLQDYEKLFSKNNIQLDVEFLDDEQRIKLDRNLIRHTLSGIFQFLLCYSENNNKFIIKLKKGVQHLILEIKSIRCTDCNKKIEDFNKSNEDFNTIFKSKLEKFLDLNDFLYISKKHQGFFTLSKTEFQSLMLSLAISQNL